MPSAAVRRARCVILGLSVVAAISLVALSLGVPVSAQSKKPASSTAKPTAKSEATASIPGVPQQMPMKARLGLRKTLQGQLDEREESRANAAKTAAEYLRQAKLATDDERAACLTLAGKQQVDALKLVDAERTFQRVMTEHSGSVWAVEASLFLFDIALEQHLDPQLAAEQLRTGLRWVETAIPQPPKAPKPAVSSLSMNELAVAGPLSLQSLGPSLLPALRPSAAGVSEIPGGAPSATAANTVNGERLPREAHRIAKDVRLRSGLLAWLREDLPTAHAEFQAALNYGGDDLTALTVLANKLRLRQRVGLLPDPVKNGDAVSAQLIRLALVLDEAPQTYRAHRLWNALANRPAEKLTLPQKSFVQFHRAQCRFRFQNPLERDADTILKDYEAAVKAYPDADWSDDALFLAGNVEFNLNRNIDRAIKLWRRVLAQHPGSEHVERSAYFIGVAYETDQKWEEAKLAYDDARTRFPKSSFNPLIDKHLKKVSDELSRPKPKPNSSG